MKKKKLEGTINFEEGELTFRNATIEFNKLYDSWVDFCNDHPDFSILNFKKKRDYEDLAYLSLHPDMAKKICN